MQGEFYAYCVTEVESPPDESFFPRGRPSKQVVRTVERAIKRASLTSQA
jgi:hypothetical protein